MEKALHTSAQQSLSSCVICLGHIHNASVNTRPKLLFFKVFKGKTKERKIEIKRERESLTFWSQILSLLENVHSCLMNQRIFWEKN